ncbi:DUF4350 domain-containing protein [Flavobacteriaceae bacterium R38]|nr:DUF4350 domain-containing protein [Flavobacteriaceae bacterium R38]
MNKKIIPLLIIIGLVFIGAIFFIPSVTKKVDWTLSFNERSTNPYGLKVFHKELARIFDNQKIRTVYHSPYHYLTAHSEYGIGDHIAEGTYMIVGNSSRVGDYYSIEELLYFASEGNTVFISDYNIPKMLKDSLVFDISFQNNKDSISTLSIHSSSDENPLEIKLDKNKKDYYFSTLSDSLPSEILGYTLTNEGKKPNFLKIPYYDGAFLIHLQPKAFTNYNLLKDNRYKYAESALSFLPDADIYFNSYLKYQTAYTGNAEQQSNLSWFLEQISFKWAWYFALMLLLLFMIFNAKRRQRVIKIIKPLENTSVAFVKTISNLYIETNDHESLIKKKITYFLEKIRTDFNLETDVLDEDFKERLILKSGKKREVVDNLLRYLDELKTKTVFSENHLFKLNKLIEDFYKK